VASQGTGGSEAFRGTVAYRGTEASVAYQGTGASGRGTRVVGLVAMFLQVGQAGSSIEGNGGVVMRASSR
jgi:hypothetical protein